MSTTAKYQKHLFKQMFEQHVQSSCSQTQICNSNVQTRAHTTCSKQVLPQAMFSKCSTFSNIFKNIAKHNFSQMLEQHGQPCFSNFQKCCYAQQLLTGQICSLPDGTLAYRLRRAQAAPYERTTAAMLQKAQSVRVCGAAASHTRPRYTHAYTRIHMFSTFKKAFEHTHNYIYTCIYVYTYSYIYIYVYICIYIYTESVYIYVYRLCIYMYIYIYRFCVYIYIFCMYIYIYICRHVGIYL
jgi:hypothetical protein